MIIIVSIYNTSSVVVTDWLAAVPLACQSTSRDPITRHAVYIKSSSVVHMCV